MVFPCPGLPATRETAPLGKRAFSSKAGYPVGSPSPAFWSLVTRSSMEKGGKKASAREVLCPLSMISSLPWRRAIALSGFSGASFWTSWAKRCRSLESFSFCARSLACSRKGSSSQGSILRASAMKFLASCLSKGFERIFVTSVIFLKASCLPRSVERSSFSPIRVRSHFTPRPSVLAFSMASRKAPAPLFRMSSSGSLAPWKEATKVEKVPSLRASLIMRSVPSSPALSLSRARMMFFTPRFRRASHCPPIRREFVRATTLEIPRASARRASMNPSTTMAVPPRTAWRLKGP
ncbi:MAG: hypothetical protein BWY86_00944 [Candidatus Aminicenantes bacterium ADurb.Bin508]|nr:MAG: hypothetical protein BWY86_00944 [Candidatus Aminicenantes bacterium ADurb.Bin508]